VPISEATRELNWNVSGTWLMYLLFVAAVAVMAYGIWRHIARWRKGRPLPRKKSGWGGRLAFMLGEAFGQRRVRGSAFPGLFHSFIFFSFIVLTITTTVVMLDEDFGTHLFKGYFYALLSVGSEIGGLLILVGVAMAAWRRWMTRPSTLETRFAETWPLILLFFMVITGFLVEGLRVSAAGDPWRGLSFAGASLAPLFGGLSADAAAATHKALWWIHTVLAMGWIASLPFGGFRHILALPANIFLRKTEAHGKLVHEDIEAMMADPEFDEANFQVGVGDSGHLTWKQRLDADACVRCGRCEEQCPPFLTGHDFSPKRMVLGLQAAMDAEAGGPQPIVGGTLGADFVWPCLTCMACVEACPAFIEHVDTFVDLRRNEVVMKAQLPADAAAALRLMETGGNPFGSQSERTDWISETGARVLGPGEECELLYFIGCATTFDPEKRHIAENLIAIARDAGVDLAVLGQAETCCGDPARVMGQEYLYQTIGKQQAAALAERKFGKILTSCPHCYNALKHEYESFGGDYELIHHSEFLKDLIDGGRLAPAGGGGKTVFHDPCYLGRYQRIFDAPRDVLKAAPDTALSEMKNHGPTSLCCGGGGGHSWIDLEPEERINNLRVAQAREAGADTLAVACPFCMQMLKDSVKLLDLDETLKVVDISEGLASGKDTPTAN